LSDLWQHHVSHSTTTATRQGAGDMLDILQPVPVAQAGLAVANKRVNPPISQVMQNWQEGKPLSTDMISNATSPSRVPGQVGTGDTFTSGQDAAWFQSVMSHIIGVAANGLTHVYNAERRADVTHDIAAAFDGFMSDVGQSWRDNAGFGNMVWGNNMKLQARNPMAEANEGAFERMKGMANVASDIQAAGLTRRGGEPVLMPATPKINPDPRIVQMTKVVGNFYQEIGTRIEPHITDLKRQISDVNSNSLFSAKDKRERLNALVAQKNDLEARKSDEISKMHASLQWLAGGKQVNIMSFDPSKGMEQFHD
jgi:hypothetical protein